MFLSCGVLLLRQKGGTMKFTYTEAMRAAITTQIISLRARAKAAEQRPYNPRLEEELYLCQAQIETLKEELEKYTLTSVFDLT